MEDPYFLEPSVWQWHPSSTVLILLKISRKLKAPKTQNCFVWHLCIFQHLSDHCELIILKDIFCFYTMHHIVFVFFILLICRCADITSYTGIDLNIHFWNTIVAFFFPIKLLKESSVSYFKMIVLLLLDPASTSLTESGWPGAILYSWQSRLSEIWFLSTC